MNKIYLVILFLAFATQCVLAQPQALPLPIVIPPSPDASALGKYGSTPVGLHTGIPDISIPLYTIKCGKLELPISISYHASGVKITDVATWVGLGWTLNAGGAISRSVVGSPDNVSGFLSLITKNETQIDMWNDWGYLKGHADGGTDGESDLYFYNFNGHTGKWVYPQNDSHPFLIPQVPIKVNYVSGIYEIIDETGTRYVFADGENMTYNGSINITYTSSYNLTEIVSADGADHIYLTYVAGGNYSEVTKNFTETIGQQCNGANTTSEGYHTSNSPTNSRGINPRRLSSITYSGGKVEFVAVADRFDGPADRLSTINVSTRNTDGSYSLRKKYTFQANHFVSSVGTGKDKYRMKLTGVTAVDALNKTVNSYGFYYNEAVNMPDRLSLAQDWWGFYNGQTTNSSLIKTQNNYVYNTYSYNIGNANREPDTTLMKACMLNKIVYPTGGYTEFDYESHLFGGSITTPASTSASCGVLGNTTTLQQTTVQFTPHTSGYATVHALCSDVTDGQPFYSTVKVLPHSEAGKPNPQYLLNFFYDYTISPHTSELNRDIPVFLTKDVTYDLTVMSKGTSTSNSLSHAAFATGSVSWEERSGGTTVGGGLRVKEIRDYEKAAAAPVKRVYKYGSDGTGIGVLLTPQYGVFNSVQTIQFLYSALATWQGINVCGQLCHGIKQVISSRPALELSSLNGAGVVYPEVTVYEGSALAPNGRTVSKFDVELDRFHYADQAYNNGHFQSNESWRGGDEVSTTVYVGNTDQKVKETSNVHAIFSNGEPVIGTKVGWKMTFEGCGMPAASGNTTYTISDYFYVFNYPYYSGIKKLTSSQEISYPSTDATNTKGVQTQTDYFYDNRDADHQQLTRAVTLTSAGDELTTRFWYPADYDYSAGNATVLVTNNVVAIPIKEEHYKNNQIVNGKVTVMDDFGNPKEVHVYESDAAQTPPVHSAWSIVPPGYTKRADLTYDAGTRRLKNVQRSDDNTTTYLWGYGNTLPIAEVKNVPAGALTSYATSNVIGLNITAAGSNIVLSPPFEIAVSQSVTPTVTVAIIGTNGPPNPFLTIFLKKIDGTIIVNRNCTWGSNSIGSITLAPGFYQWSYSTNLTTGSGFNGDRLDITTSYNGQLTGYKAVHTSFEEDGAVDASAITGTRVWNGTYTLKLPGYAGDYKITYWQKSGATWSLIEQTSTVAQGNYLPSVVIGLAGGSIDEVRVFPPGAMMTTYTYDTALGITSTTDPNNVTSYYKYDDFGRLSIIKDSKGNRVRSYAYHYKE